MKHLLSLLTLLSVSFTAFAQHTITGEVEDQMGETVPGATVILKDNPTIGTITDTKGNATPVESLMDLLEQVRARGRKGMSIYRFKGLGEMDADELYDTTMDPTKRHMLRVQLSDAVKADQMFSLLMGEEVAPRCEFIEQNATYAEIDA